jgi:transcriptional regulator with XRE-family HTH domain
MLAAALQQRRLGEQVAARRHRQGLSQAELALRMGSTQRIVSKIENGGDVNISTLHRCLAELGLALRVVTGGQHERRSRVWTGMRARA